MTEPERQALRALIDSARRARVHRERATEKTDPLPTMDGKRRCHYCSRWFDLSKCPANAAKQKFCSTTHKANWWRRERMRRDKARRQARLQRAAA